MRNVNEAKQILLICFFEMTLFDIFTTFVEINKLLHVLMVNYIIMLFVIADLCCLCFVTVCDGS